MSRCELTGKSPVSKNRVSHSNIKTKSRAQPNIQKKSFYSDQLKTKLRFKVATSALKNIDKASSFDVFIVKQDDKNLSPSALSVKRKILKRTRNKK